MKHHYSYLLFMSALVTTQASAVSNLIARNPTLGPLNDFSGRTTFYGGEMNRDAYQSIGINYVVQQTSDNMVEDGELWDLKLVDASDDTSLQGSVKFVALISPNHDGKVCINYLPSSGIPSNTGQCFSKTLEQGQTENAYFGRNYNMECEEPIDFKIMNRHSVGTYINPDEYMFSLSDYVPTDPIVTGVSNITPHVPNSVNGTTGVTTSSYSAGIQSIGIDIVDNKSCGIPLPDIEVELKNTIVRESGDHLHFDIEGLYGTGKYTSSTPDALTSTLNDTAITVLTDNNGHIDATYEAGIYGVDETLMVTVHKPNSSNTIENNV